MPCRGAGGRGRLAAAISPLWFTCTIVLLLLRAENVFWRARGGNLPVGFARLPLGPSLAAPGAPYLGLRVGGLAASQAPFPSWTVGGAPAWHPALPSPGAHGAFPLCRTATRDTGYLGLQPHCHTRCARGPALPLCALKTIYRPPHGPGGARPPKSLREPCRAFRLHPAVPWCWIPASPSWTRRCGLLGWAGLLEGTEVSSSSVLPAPPGPVGKVAFPLNALGGDLAGGSRLAPRTPKLDGGTGHGKLAGSCPGGKASARTLPRGVSALGPRTSWGLWGGDALSPGSGAVPSQAPSFSPPARDGARRHCPLDFFLLPN